MIRFVLTRGFTDTVAEITERQGWPQAPPCEAVTYTHLFRSRTARPGTYIFGDIERLSDAELALASEAFRALAAAGSRVRLLNDPAKVRTRFGLLRTLRESGFNEFDAYRAEGLPRPKRFPVFVRAEWQHEPALTGLLPDQQALDEALSGLIAAGRPLRGLIVIEYRAEPAAPGLFRRYGTFRLGGAVFLDHVVTEDSWNVKWGKLGLVGDDVYARDDTAVRANLFEQPLRRAFELAGIDYGRADFGLVGGDRPQVYEINTNPFLLWSRKPHPSRVRQATLEFARDLFRKHFSALDTPETGPPIPIRGDFLDANREHGDWPARWRRRVSGAARKWLVRGP